MGSSVLFHNLPQPLQTDAIAAALGANTDQQDRRCVLRTVSLVLKHLMAGVLSSLRIAGGSPQRPDDGPSATNLHFLMLAALLGQSDTAEQEDSID